MGRRARVPTLAYEVIPSAFVPPGEGSVLSRMVPQIEHLAALSVDALVLPSLFPTDASGKHTTDFRRIDSAIGTEDDLAHLCAVARTHEIDVVMSGVFDHVSDEHPWFVAAKDHGDDETAFAPHLRTRNFFLFRDAFPHGYACADREGKAPVLDLRQSEVRRRLFTGEASVLHHWLEVGIAGWRLERAEAVGYSILRELRRGTMTVEGEHFVIGDIRGFADRYTKDGLLDGVVNHYLREALVGYLRARIPARQVSRVLRDLARRYGSSLNRAWLPLSLSCKPRLPSVFQDPRRTRLSSILAYTLPGTPLLLFGDEMAREGKAPPLPARPMEWRKERWNQEVYDLHVTLGRLRREHPALVHGEFVDVTPEGEEEIVAFARVTKDPRETVLVAVNRASQTRVRTLFAPVNDLPDGLPLCDLLDGTEAKVRSGTVTLEVRGQDVRILVPNVDTDTGPVFFRDY